MNESKTPYEYRLEGIEIERERIIKLLENQIEECEEECDFCIAQRDAIALIRGELS
jgi:hypothetical protein